MGLFLFLDGKTPHLVYKFKFIWVEVLRYFQAVENFSIWIEFAGLQWFLGIKRRSPVIEETSSINKYKSFNIIKLIIGWY